MQAPSADETIQRLIFGLSELDELGETIISGHGNFSVSSRTYLRMILGTLQVVGGRHPAVPPEREHAYY